MSNTPENTTLSAERRFTALTQRYVPTQVACDALGAKLFESQPPSNGTGDNDDDVALQGGTDLDAAVAYSE